MRHQHAVAGGHLHFHLVDAGPVRHAPDADGRRAVGDVNTIVIRPSVVTVPWMVWLESDTVGPMASSPVEVPVKMPFVDVPSDQSVWSPIASGLARDVVVAA